MNLVDDLYAGKAIPKGTKPEKVELALGILSKKLNNEMEKRHVWLAACFRAVQAGLWRGERLRKRRTKLLGMINECREHLQWDPAQLPQGWEMTGLYYGFGALEKYGEESGLNLRDTLVLGNVLSNTQVNNDLLKNNKGETAYACKII